MLLYLFAKALDCTLRERLEGALHLGAEVLGGLVEFLFHPFVQLVFVDRLGRAKTGSCVRVAEPLVDLLQNVAAGRHAENGFGNFLIRRLHRVFSDLAGF
jgi:hypothetical protein